MVQGDYSYVFSGLWGKLDHVFIKDDALSTVDASAIVWHCNADEFDYIDYNLDYGRDPAVFDPSIPERFSDHDPIIVALNFTSSPITNLPLLQPTPSPTDSLTTAKKAKKPNKTHKGGIKKLQKWFTKKQPKKPKNISQQPWSQDNAI